MSSETVTILCSGVALGVYIPGISLHYQLQSLGVDTEVIVLENLLRDDCKSNIDTTKKAFHNNFRFAQMGQKLARSIVPSLDDSKVHNLFARWKLHKRHHFIILSGFWLPIIDSYRTYIYSISLKIDILHMDAVPSPSWKSFKCTFPSDMRIFYLFSYIDSKIHFHLNVSSQKPLPFNKRQPRFLIHGGGWGMGTYRNTLHLLEKQGFVLDIMAYDVNEIPRQLDQNRYFMVNPQWSPWHKNTLHKHTFPPVAIISSEQKTSFEYRSEYHELYYIGASDIAIISKPGGSTLVDSFSSATPLIFLDSFGPHEAYNADLWIKLGFGIRFSEWEHNNFSIDRLKQCHENLIAAYDTIPDFIENYLFLYSPTEHNHPSFHEHVH